MSKAPHVLMLFLDGVGIGHDDPRWNPFFASPPEVFKLLFGNKIPHMRDAHRSSSMMSLVPVNETNVFSARSEQAALKRLVCATVQLVRNPP